MWAELTENHYKKFQIGVEQLLVCDIFFVLSKILGIIEVRVGKTWSWDHRKGYTVHNHLIALRAAPHSSQHVESHSGSVALRLSCHSVEVKSTVLR